MVALRERWRRADAGGKERATSGATATQGVRRVGDAVEYDFAAMREDDIDDDGEHMRNPKALPREVRYFDTAVINIKAGDGGNGCCAFRREKFVAHGGPSGGNGGHGGSVWVVADEGLNALTSFRNQVHWKAANGASGQGKDMHGANSPDLLIKVPPGTIVRDKESRQDGARPLAELLAHGDKALLVQGGRGGRGNAAFKSAKNKAPIIAEEGEVGPAKWVELELKVIADVAIIGVPNAGKSTLLSVLSSAKPKVADYPFTTLVPNLGVCEMDYETTTFADVPGLIEGAHRGEGLGHEFLRHCSRSRALVHVVDGTSPDPLYDYRAIRLELELFNPALLDKPEIVVYNKIDVPDSADYIDDVRELLVSSCGVKSDNVLPISAVSGAGVLQLVRKVRSLLKSLPQSTVTADTDAVNAQQRTSSATDAAQLRQFTIEASLDEDRVWIVRGAALERFAQMTSWDYFEATLRFQRVLEACGLWKALKRRGVRAGDAVVIGDVEFEWSNERSEGALYEAWIDDMNARGRVGKGMARWPHMAG